MRDRGHEFGTTTGRQRRCGWLDLVALRYATRLNRLTALAITKLDVLCGLDPLRVASATAARRGRCSTSSPTTSRSCTRRFPSTRSCPAATRRSGLPRGFADLPAAARDYLGAISDSAGVPISLVGVGPGRDEVIGSAAAEALAGNLVGG